MANRVGSGDVLGILIFILMIISITTTVAFSIKTANDQRQLSEEYIKKIPQLNVPQAELDKIAEDGEITVGEYNSLEKLSKENDRRDFIQATLKKRSK